MGKLGFIRVLYGSGGVHIRCCGNGGWRFRSYSGSLLANARNAGPAKSNQKVFAPPLGASPRLGMPSLRPAWLTGPVRSQANQKQKHGGLKADLSGRSKSTATHFYLMHRDPNVGAGLPANAVGQSAHVSLAHRLREQARSHKLTEFSRQHRTAFALLWELACLRCRHLGLSGTPG